MSTVKLELRRKATVVAWVLAVVIGVSGFALVNQRPHAAPSSSHHGADPVTAAVEMATLTNDLRLSARLHYGDPQPMPRVPGTLTQLPAPGAVIERGEQVVEADGVPIVLFTGERPFWRELSTESTDGHDVYQLEQNLAALGFLNREPGNTFDNQTRDAVRAWQESLGIQVTPTAGAADIRAAAAQRVSDAQHQVTQAEQSLHAARYTGPNAGAATQADAAVSAAYRGHEAAVTAQHDHSQGCAFQTRMDCDPADFLRFQHGVDNAADAVQVAHAARNALHSAPDVTLQTQNLENARRNLTTAQRELAEADRALSTQLPGVFDPASVIVAATDAIRIDQVTAQLGDFGLSPALITETALRATATLTEAQSRELTAGTPVTVTLPDGSTTAAALTNVCSGGQMTESGVAAPSAVVQFPVGSLPDGTRPGAAGLTVHDSAEREPTLVVPVASLLANANGGHAVEVWDPVTTTTRRVPVEIGLVADARAQILSSDLAASDFVAGGLVAGGLVAGGLVVGDLVVLAR